MSEYLYSIIVTSSAVIILAVFMVKNHLSLKKQEAILKKNEKKI